MVTKPPWLRGFDPCLAASSLVDRLLEAKREKVDKGESEAIIRSGVPPPPSILPIRSGGNVRGLAIELLQSALVADPANSNNHDSLVTAAAAQAQKALLKALEPGNHPEKLRLCSRKNTACAQTYGRYIKSVSQPELNSAVSYLEGEVADVIGQP